MRQSIAALYQIFTFTGATGAFVEAALVSIGFFPTDNITFSSATLNGRSFTITSTGITEVATLGTGAFSGPLTMTVTGVAGGSLPVGTAIAASYGGTLNVSPVPEAGTLAMMLAGLGIVGALGRKRLAA